MFSCQERVYYEDTDAGGIVYHANYLKFMERCRCLWLENIGFNIQTLQDDQGVLFVVKEASLEYIEPARLFDKLQVELEVLQVGKVRVQLSQKIYNADKLLCKAHIKLATLDSTSFKLAAMPEALRSAMAKS